MQYIESEQQSESPFEIGLYNDRGMILGQRTTTILFFRLINALAKRVQYKQLQVNKFARVFILQKAYQSEYSCTRNSHGNIQLILKKILRKFFGLTFFLH